MQICELQGFSRHELSCIFNAYTDMKLGFGYKKITSRRSGEPYYHHPKAVALVDMLEFGNRNPAKVIAELQHDSVEDVIQMNGTENHPHRRSFQTTFGAEELLTQRYGPEAAKIILAMTKPHKPKENMNPDERERYLFFSYSQVVKRYPEVAVEAAQGKVCDRIVNTRSETDDAKAAKNLVESYRFVMPLAERAGENYREGLKSVLDERKGVLTPAQRALCVPVKY